MSLFLFFYLAMRALVKLGFAYIPILSANRHDIGLNVVKNLGEEL